MCRFYLEDLEHGYLLITQHDKRAIKQLKELMTFNEFEALRTTGFLLVHPDMNPEWTFCLDQSHPAHYWDDLPRVDH